MGSEKIKDICVLLFGFGGLTSLKDIYSFLGSIIGSKPEKALVEKLTARYKLIGGSSPLVNITFKQAKELEKKLKGSGLNLKVFVTMLHGKPSVRDTLIKLKSENFKSIMTVIMTPYYVPTITEAYKMALENTIDNLGLDFNLFYAGPWHIHPLFLKAVTENIKKGISKFPEERQDSVEIIFTSHSLPQESNGVSSYTEYLKETIKALHPLPEGHLAFQSQGSKGIKWLGPSLLTILKRLSKRGVKDILIVPIGFVSDHLETLYDLDILAKKEAKSAGINLIRSDSLNASSKFIEALSCIIDEGLEKWQT
ncbi:MAG: ferrochelatase [Thermodesulfobacteriota bacterium]|nr:ferrochelatase [Thermodesulfobacteriota bacterium]